MYCRNCKKEVAEQAIMCVSCGVPPRAGKKYCQDCGAKTDPNAAICVKCGVKLAQTGKDWLVTLLLCIFLGGLGVHRFYTGNIGMGVGQLMTLGGCGIWTLIDFILIVTDAYRDANGAPLVHN